MTSQQEQIFNKIYKTYYESIVGLCNIRLNGDEDTAKEIAEEVFFTLSVKWDSLNSHTEAAIVAWIYSTAKNLIYNQIRSSIRKQKTFISLDEFIEQGGDIADNFTPHHASEYELYIKTIEKQLSSEEFRLFNYIVNDNYSISEIALIFDMNPNTVKTRWSRLRKKLQKIIKNI